jgi:hypothetical protein
MADVDAKIEARKASLAEKDWKGLLERGAINDPESKALYDDLVDLAGLYAKKGMLTVEEFAKEIGVKVNKLVQQAWDDAMQAKGELDELNKSLDLPESEAVATPGKRTLSAQDIAVANEDMIKRVKAARAVLDERKGAVADLRKKQKAVGMSVYERSGGGEAGHLASRAAMSGEAEKVYTGLGEAQFDQAIRDYVIDTPERVYKENPAIFFKSKKRTGEFWTPANARDALIDLMAGKSLPEHQVKLLEKLYGAEFIKEAKQTTWGKIQDILGIPKTLLASIDHSFPGRQGWVINSANPEIMAKNIKDAVGSFWSEKYYEALKARVLNDPEFKIASEAGLDFTDTGLSMMAREESYPSRLMDKVPGIKQSNRSFTWAANAQRIDAWKKFKSWLGDNPKTGELEKLADFINLATGRGDLGKFSRLGSELNTVFFSPKLFAARLELPLRALQTASDPRMRKIYWRNVGASMGVTVTALGLLKGMSEIPQFKDHVYVETDMRSADFGKAIIGDTHVDLTGGNAQLIYLMARVFTGTRMSGGGVQYDTNGMNELMRYLRYKSAPVMGLGYDWLTGESVSGKKFGTKDYWSEKVPGSVVPMWMQDAADAYTHYGLGGAFAIAVPSVFGIGMNTYEPGATTQEKRLGTPKYSDEQLSTKSTEAHEKYLKPGVNDTMGMLAVQAKLDKAASEYYTTIDLRTYLRRSGAKDYRATPLQKYFNESIPVLDKWEQDSAIKDKKFSYTPQEKATLSFWGVIKTDAGNKIAAKQKLKSLGLPEEAAPWLYAK